MFYSPELEAKAARMFPLVSQDQQKQQWMADRESEQLDRQQGNSYFIRVR
jgi:hypothetical protein